MVTNNAIFTSPSLCAKSCYPRLMPELVSRESKRKIALPRERGRRKENGNIMIHIHAPQATAKKINKDTCPDCKKRTIFLNFYTPWYGWDSTCIRCGRTWAEGEWMSLDFVRQARQKSINYAKKLWRAMPSIEQNHYGV